MKVLAHSLAVLALCVLGLALAPTADDLDTFVQPEMARRQINGLSIAIIQDGKIDARAYGVTSPGGAPVTTATLFQAGSISKPVAAMGALKLVEGGQLSLDRDVNAELKTWKVPDNEFTTTQKVTLRRLLSHTAGLTVHGFPGYDVKERMPSVVQVLNGEGNTAAARAAEAASGFFANRSAVAGRWHVYPEMAAAGLWTTPSDLARFAIEVQQALAGKSHKVLSQAMTRQQLSTQMNNFGLGLALSGTGSARTFGHNGRDEGFDAQMLAFAETGRGVVIMINANDNSRMMSRIVDFVARRNKWPLRAAA